MRHTISRRKWLAMASGTLLTACGGGGSSSGGGTVTTPPPSPPPPAPPSLDAIKDAAAAKNMYFGATINTGATYNDASYRELMSTHCNLAVAENDHKWEALRPSPSSYTFGNGDELVDWTRGQGIDFRYHTLLWEAEERYPDWFDTYDFGSDPATEAERLLTDHIQTVAQRYAGDMVSWDVVNEAVHNATGAYRSSPFSRALGGMEPVLDIAFHTARTELPSAQLVYNDFMSWYSDSTHRDGVLRLLEGMLNRGTPIDALGIQSHIWGGNSGGFGSDETAWRTFLDEVTGMGLGLVLTEFDVDDKDLPADIETRDEQVAEVTREYLSIMFDYEEVRTLTCWGLVNGYSWLQGFNPRADGRDKRPLPFDDDYNPTPMAFAIRDAFEGATARG